MVFLKLAMVSTSLFKVTLPLGFVFVQPGFASNSWQCWNCMQLNPRGVQMLWTWRIYHRSYSLMV